MGLDEEDGQLHRSQERNRGVYLLSHHICSKSTCPTCTVYRVYNHYHLFGTRPNVDHLLHSLSTGRDAYPRTKET